MVSRTLNIVLIAFLISCIFDPADRFLGLKTWLFIAAWFVTLLYSLESGRGAHLPWGLLFYTAIFISIPILSIVSYFLIDGSEPFEGFSLLKGYLLITFAPMLFIDRIDLFSKMALVLSMLAIIILSTFIAVLFLPDLYPLIYEYGGQTGIVLPDFRNYGNDITMMQLYFVTSPMLAMSIAWYAECADRANNLVTRIGFIGLVLIHAIAMCIAGTRNNILVAITLPLVLWLFYSSKRLLVGCIVCLIFLIIFSIFFNEIQAFFSLNEVSNATKLELLADYVRIFSDPWVLFFGRGLGSYEMWFAKAKFDFITELTYFEIVRNYGLLSGIVLFGLILKPIWDAFFLRKALVERGLAIGYIFYLAMCFSNPNFFSSMGILILSLLLSRSYLNSLQK